MAPRELVRKAPAIDDALTEGPVVPLLPTPPAVNVNEDVEATDGGPN